MKIFLNIPKKINITTKSINALMVEITFQKKEIFQLLEKYGFQECYENSKSRNYFLKK